MTPNNPLKQYFRQPAIYVKLPSQGQFYPPGSIDMPPNGEIPVLPMTAVDEITYRTPDALFNGSAMVSVIQSCIPNIRDPWAIPAMDIDTILVAIRVASYGHELDLSSQCPACKHEYDIALDLRNVMDQFQTPDYKVSVSHGDLEFFFKPMTYRDLNNNNQMQFEQQKIMNLLPDTELPDSEKISSITDALKKITQITIDALSQSVAAVKTPSALVNEAEFIRELMQNCDRVVFNSVKDHIISLKNATEIKPLSLTCPSCKNQYEQGFTMDMSSFFEVAS
jgi:hypothetical protein